MTPQRRRSQLPDLSQDLDKDTTDDDLKLADFLGYALAVIDNVRQNICKTTE